MATIATLSDALDTAAKFFRVMEREGVERSHYQHPIDSRTARRNLADFLKKGCSDIQVVGEFVPDLVSLLTSQQLFYRCFFGLELDFSSVRIPEGRSGFTRLLVIAQGLTPNRVYEVCQQNFPCWRYTDDLDVAINWDKEERNPKDGPYAIWVRDTVEADEELKNLSANQIQERGLTTETLTERLSHELVHWHETKEHLDIHTITNCTGSRYQGGDVPSVDWHRHNGEVSISDCLLDTSSGGLRSREVVS